MTGELIQKLLVADTQVTLPGVALEEQIAISEKEVHQLLMLASQFACESEAASRMLAYEICTRLVELYGEENPLVVVASQTIMKRLGNFPGADLLSSRYVSSDAITDPLTLSLESTARRSENSIPVGNARELFTDLQVDLMEVISASSVTSLSAPTSAGKSYVLCMDIVRRISTAETLMAVYVVPTRALIRQVSRNISATLARHGLSKVPVRTLPLPFDKEILHGVYVLTQERLLSLLGRHDANQDINALYIDEAHGLGGRQSGRGIRLHHAVDLVRRRHPEATVVFSSPLASNPEYLLSLFDAPAGATFLIDERPVTQNLIYVKEVAGKPTHARFYLQRDAGLIDLGSRELPFSYRHSPGGKLKQLAQFAISIGGTEEGAIVYYDYPSRARGTAVHIANEIDDQNVVHEDVLDFAAFVREYIHPEYPLAECLEKGVAYHYGNMPTIVRSRVEDLFHDGKLSYICCTSTLLQGVNLPAKSIILESPKLGGLPLTRSNFLNLAGRAGRLRQEFHGNVWCLRPETWHSPDNEAESALNGAELHPIESEMVEALSNGASLITRLLDDELAEGENEIAAIALGKTYSDYMEGYGLPLWSGLSEPERAALEERCQKLPVTLPIGVIQRNFAINPIRLQSLYDFLSSQEQLAIWIPSLNDAEILRRVIRALNEILGGETHESYAFDSWLASRWVFHSPLRKIIEDRHAFRKKRGENATPAQVIEEISKALEQRIRYRLVYRMRAYIDLLEHILSERGEKELGDGIFQIPLCLECGARDPIALSLIALGLTRTTALLLMKAVEFGDSPTPEGMRKTLRALDLTTLSLPRTCVEELRFLS